MINKKINDEKCNKIRSIMNKNFAIFAALILMACQSKLQIMKPNKLITEINLTLADYGLKGNVKQVQEKTFHWEMETTYTKNTDTVQDINALVYKTKNEWVEKLQPSVTYNFNKNGFIESEQFDSATTNYIYKNNFIDTIIGHISAKCIYNAQNQLIQINKYYDKIAKGPNQVIKYQYNNDGLIISSNETIPDGMPDMIEGTKMFYSYNSKNQLETIKMVRKMEQFTDVSICTLTYDSYGNIIKQDDKQLLNTEYSHATTFEFNQHNDLIAVIVGNEKFAPDYVYEYQYDAHGNWITRIKKRVPLPYDYENEVSPDGRLVRIQKMKTKQTLEEEKRRGRYEEKIIRTIAYYEQ